MKTRKLTRMLLAIFFLVPLFAISNLPFSSFNNTLKLTLSDDAGNIPPTLEECYIVENSVCLIPFNANIKPEPETYINDIPFDTEEIARKYEMIFPYIEEEQNVNDIPFDTEEVARQYEVIFPYFEEETYIDDIPFDTHEQIALPAR